MQIFVWQAHTLWKTCANICPEAILFFLRSCAQICLQANTLLRTCANICPAGKYSLEKLRKYLSGSKYFFKSCANICLQASTLLRTCVNMVWKEILAPEAAQKFVWRQILPWDKYTQLLFVFVMDICTGCTLYVSTENQSEACFIHT